MKYEFLRIWKSRRSRIAAAFIVSIPFFDLFTQIKASIFQGGWWPYEHLTKAMIDYPARVSFLSGNSIGHIGQMLLIWILPIHLLLLNADSPIQDHLTGYVNIIHLKLSGKEILTRQLSFSFLISGGIMLVSLLVNYVLALLIFNGGKYGLYYLNYNLNPIFNISAKHPDITSLIYVLIFSILAGIFGVVCFCLSLLFADYRIVYPLAFVIWFLQIMAPNSLTFIIQPFIEYGLPRIVPALLVFLISSSLIVGATYAIKVKSDVF